MNAYELLMKICLECTCHKGKIHPDAVNPVLEKFKGMLEDFRFVENSLKASPLVVDDFNFEERKDRVLFSYSIRWQVNDSGPNATWNFNNHTRGALKKAIDKLEFISKKGIKIRVINSMYVGDIKEGEWPRERYF